MNDWLDYKGSGSSRAYIAHGILDSIPEAIANKKQNESEYRLILAKKELFDSLMTDYKNAELNCNAAQTKAVRYRTMLKDIKKDLADIESEYKKAREKSPLDAHTKYSALEHQLKSKADEYQRKLDKCNDDAGRYATEATKIKSKMLKIEREIAEYNDKHR